MIYCIQSAWRVKRHKVQYSVNHLILRLETQTKRNRHLNNFIKRLKITLTGLYNTHYVNNILSSPYPHNNPEIKISKSRNISFRTPFPPSIRVCHQTYVTANSRAAADVRPPAYRPMTSHPGSSGPRLPSTSQL